MSREWVDQDVRHAWIGRIEGGNKGKDQSSVLVGEQGTCRRPITRQTHATHTTHHKPHAALATSQQNMPQHARATQNMELRCNLKGK